jgi:hypothetical protein
MKTVTVLGGIVLLGILAFHFLPSTKEFVNERIVEIEVKKVETVDVLTDKIATAVEAAQASTTAKAQAAYEAVVKEEKAKIELQVRQAYRKELEAKEIELERQSGF